MRLEGKHMRVNQSLCRLLGYSADDLLELTFQDITRPEELSEDLDLPARLVAGRIQTYSLRKRYLHADGHVIRANLSVELVRNARGEPLHFVPHVADLTEEMKAAERIEQLNLELHEQKARLERSDADLEALAMLASHDLQAPLATNRGYMEPLTGEYGDLLDPRAQEGIGRAGQASERMSELVSSLPECRSRVTGAGPLTREEVSVTALAQEVRQDLEHLINETGATVEVAADTPNPRGAS